MTAVTKIRTDEVAFRKARMLIGGKWVDSASGEVLEVEDPAHRRPIAEVPRGGVERKGETIPFGEHVLSYTRREPLGVVGAITPWNAPVLLAALKIGPALCAGNTLVLKAA